MAGVSREMSFKTQEETVLLLLKNWREIAVSLTEPNHGLYRRAAQAQHGQSADRHAIKGFIL